MTQAQLINPRGNSNNGNVLGNFLKEKGIDLALTGTAAAIGALVGTVVAPGVGTVAGAKLGASAAGAASAAEGATAAAKAAEGAAGASKIGQIGQTAANTGKAISDVGGKLGATKLQNFGTKMAQGGQQIAQKGADFANWQRNTFGDTGTKLINGAVSNGIDLGRAYYNSNQNNLSGNPKFIQADNQFNNDLSQNGFAEGGIVGDKGKSFMGKVWEGVEKALPYADFTNDLEQIGNLWGISEEDRNNSRLEKLVTGKRRPISHNLIEATAWNGANVVPEAIMAIVKGANYTSKAAKAAKKFNDGNKVVQDILRMDTDDILDPRIISMVKETGNTVSRDGVNAAKTVKKGRAIRNTARGAWAENGQAAERLLDDVKDGITLREILDNAPREAEWGVNRPGRLNESVKKGAKKEALKGAATVEAINKGLSELHTLDDIKKAEVEPLYRKPIIAGDTYWRMVRQGLNTEANFLDLGWDVDKYPMEMVNKLVNEINKDDYFDQREIDDLADVEKIWFLRNLAKGKYNMKGHNKSLELLNIYEDLTNNSEDKKNGK